MCLLHTHPANTPFDEADIKDFYLHNSDGLGVMWSENDVLYTHKCLPKTADDAWKFYQEHIQNRDCVVHWRMKTHGLIDLENCHPYTIFGAGSEMPMSLMHNGVLFTGNTKDIKKSDTWHYIEDWLKPLLAEHPEMFLNPIMQALIKDHIGSGNRFILMNHKGEQAIINEKDFVTYKGALLSNTYAWDSSKGGFGSKYASFQSHRSAFAQGQENEEYFYGGAYHWRPQTSSGGAATSGTAATTNTRTSWQSGQLRAKAQEFFQLLTHRNFLIAFQELSFIQVEDSIEIAGHAIWKDFVEVITADQATDIDIIKSVESDDHMLKFLYGFCDTDTTTPTQDELKHEQKLLEEDNKKLLQLVQAELEGVEFSGGVSDDIHLPTVVNATYPDTVMGL